MQSLFRQQPAGEKIAAILAVWIVLEPLLAVLMLVFWGRQRDPSWLPALIPALYLSLVGGVLQSCLYLISPARMATSVVLSAVLGVGAAVIAFATSVSIHEVRLLRPVEIPRLIPLVQVALLGPLVAIFSCVAIIRGNSVRQ